MKYKKMTIALLFLFCAISGYIINLMQRPVEIIAIYGSEGFSDVLVKNFPWTDRGKINWWLKNKAMLKDKYNIPKPDEDFFSITFWLFGEGYKEEGKHDLLCFEEINYKKRCIDKDALLSVNQSNNRGMTFRTYDGKYYLDQRGLIIKNKNQQSQTIGLSNDS